RAWFEVSNYKPDLNYLQVFWCIGCVERQAINTGASALSLARLSEQLQTLNPQFDSVPLPIGVKSLAKILGSVDGFFDKEPFYAQAWPDEERGWLRDQVNNRGDA